MQRLQGLLVSEHATDPPQNAVSRGTPFPNPPTSRDWERIKPTIEQLYVTDKNALKLVRDILRDRHGFRASERMIKSRLQAWGFFKNAKKNDWGYLATLHQKRQREGKLTTFEVHGQRKTLKDLQRFIRNQNLTTDQFLDEHRTQNADTEIPTYIRAFTPDGTEQTESPSSPKSFDEPASPSTTKRIYPRPSTFDHHSDDDSHQNPYPPHPTHPPRHSSSAIPLKRERTESSLFLTPQQQQPPPPPPLNSVSGRYQVYCTGSSIQLRQDNAPPARLKCPDLHFELEACVDQLLVTTVEKRAPGRIWDFMTKPEPPEREPGEPEPISNMSRPCPRCGHPYGDHTLCLEDFETKTEQRSILNDSVDGSLHIPVSTREEGSWTWMARCLLACMCMSGGEEATGDEALKDAAVKFEKFLIAKDRLLLTAAGLMAALLHMHNQGGITERVMQSAKEVADRILPATDPVRVTFDFHHCYADAGAPKKNIHSAVLERAYLDLHKTYGTTHPYVIAAHHNYAWKLKHEGEFAAAETHARQVVEASEYEHGEEHMQTVTALAIFAGCIAGTLEQHPSRARECIDTYAEVTARATKTLGVDHPYTLEARRRLANIMLDSTHLPELRSRALEHHRAVLEGRLSTLGRNHAFTTGQLHDYSRHLKRYGQWESIDGRPTAEQQWITRLFPTDAGSYALGQGQRWMVMGKEETLVGSAPGAHGQRPSGPTFNETTARAF